MRIWNPTQVDIADRATRLVGRIHVSDPTTPAVMAAVEPISPLGIAMAQVGLDCNAVIRAYDGTTAPVVRCVKAGEPSKHLGIGDVLDADPYGNYSFNVYAIQAAGGAGQSPGVKLENPAASGKTLVVERIVAVGSTARPINISIGNIHEAGDGGAALAATQNRNYGSATAPVALRHTIANAAGLGQFIWGWDPGILGVERVFSVPLRVPEGNGVMTRLLTSVGADSIGVNYAWREE